jgi:hypothetical protein
MKSFHLYLLACMAAVLLLCAGCNYTEPVMYVEIANRSGQKLENVVVQYPRGAFGLPMLRDGQTHRRMLTLGSPCKFSIAFQYPPGTAHSSDFDLGTKCPTEELFEVGPGLRISARRGRS